MNKEYSYNLKLLLEESTYYNEIFIPQIIRELVPHFFQSWFRNCVCGALVFTFTSLFICLNFWKNYFYSSKENVVTRRELIKQIKESMVLLPLGALFLTLLEYLGETGWTRCYTRISDVGLVTYVFSTLMYVAIIDFWTYWIHRYMHQIKPIYKYIHAIHHSYNKETSLSPFAGWALHPLDGLMLQVPHGIAFLLMPTHYLTFLTTFLIGGMWGVLVHGGFNLAGPFMDAQFHTIHHISTQTNFGNFTIYMDKWFGTLRNFKEPF